MAEIVLITGGARSGKSSYALQVGEESGQSRTFIATCPTTSEIDDSELQERVQRHRQERLKRGWHTVEELLNIAEILANDSADIILVDCLTLWVNNLLYNDNNINEDVIRSECMQLIETCRKREGKIIFVTNEVGWGIVPGNSIARRYRDLVGRCNQVIAQGADQVFFVISSLPVRIKGDM